ncbi:cytochrome P450 4C1-like [Periplaneta americana]|uniref:cytochrome P450 4C1-like n=1 Tax=Periplaneta americana TaxID=6978 RepID=UPI0037E89C46
MLLVALYTFLVGIGILWALFIAKTHRMKKMTVNIPGPKMLPIVGNGLEVGSTSQDFLQYCDLLYKKYPKICRAWFLQQLLVFINNTEDCKTLLTDMNLLDKAFFYKYFEPFFGQGLVTGTGAKWMQNRKYIAPNLNVSVFKSNVQIANRHVYVTLNKLSQHVGRQEFDIYPFMLHQTMKVSIATLMGKEPEESLILDILDTLMREKDTILHRVLRPWFEYDFLHRNSKNGRMQTKNVEKITKHMNEISSDKTKDREGAPNMSPVILKLLQELKEKNLCTERYIHEELYTLIVAGSDTSATGLAFTAWLLSRHPDIQDRVVQELQQVFGDSDRPATYEDLQQMKYLEMVLKESLRMYPPIPLVGRRLTQDYKIGDHVIPAGANLMFFIKGIQNDPRYFPEPDNFDPDRFLPENTKDRDSLSYIPFGYGPRICVGQKQGMVMMKTGMSGLLRRYKLLPGTTPLSLDYQVNLISSTGITVRLAER